MQKFSELIKSLTILNQTTIRIPASMEKDFASKLLVRQHKRLYRSDIDKGLFPNSLLTNFVKNRVLLANTDSDMAYMDYIQLERILDEVCEGFYYIRSGEDVTEETGETSSDDWCLVSFERETDMVTFRLHVGSS